MRIAFSIFVFLFSAQVILAQSAEDEVIRLKKSMAEQSMDEEVSSVQNPVENPAGAEKDAKRGHWNFSVGSSFSYMQGYGSMVGLYAAPMYTLPLNDRWAVHGGLIASNYTGMGNQMPGPEYALSNNFSSLAVFAAASYKMTDRLILHGSGYKNLTSYPLMPMAPGVMDNISMGATYKLGDNVSIGASVRINQGRGAYGNPYGGNYFGGPFASPFASPFGW